ncbi:MULTISPECIES: response regulator [unclassified Sinorhizobium]|uniref:response regulator n=1 Tax=unclassified Sinorhizobium TaxID=2613772 RepID=UPI0035238EA0
MGVESELSRAILDNDGSVAPVVLIVEDEYLIGTDLADMIETDGASVLGPAATIQAALALIRATEKIDAAVLDINIRNETVFEVADALVARGVPFLFTSGYDVSAIPERFQQICRHQKPVDYKGLAHDLVGLIAF